MQCTTFVEWKKIIHSLAWKWEWGEERKALLLPFILREVNFSHHHHISGILLYYHLFLETPIFIIAMQIALSLRQLCAVEASNRGCIWLRQPYLLTLVLYRSRNHNIYYSLKVFVSTMEYTLAKNDFFEWQNTFHTWSLPFTKSHTTYTTNPTSESCSSTAFEPKKMAALLLRPIPHNTQVYPVIKWMYSICKKPQNT